MSQFIEKTEPNGIVMYIAVSAVIGILMVTGQFTAISLRSEVKELRKRIDTLEVKHESVAKRVPASMVFPDLHAAVRLLYVGAFYPL